MWLNNKILMHKGHFNLISKMFLLNRLFMDSTVDLELHLFNQIDDMTMDNGTLPFSQELESMFFYFNFMYCLGLNIYDKLQTDE